MVYYLGQLSGHVKQQFSANLPTCSGGGQEVVTFDTVAAVCDRRLLSC